MSRGVFVTDEQVRLTGNANTARFLAQCLYWSTRDVVERRQGWFYKTRDEWQAETWLSRYQQEKARERLRELGVLQERRERLNTGIRLWFCLDRRLLNVLINRLVNQDTEESTTTLYDSTSFTGIKEDKEDIEVIDKNSCISTESKSVEDTDTPSINSYIPVIQTNVGLSEKHCKTPEIHAAQYLACHPLIYQFIRTRLAIAPRNPQHLDLINRFCQQGMTESLVAEVFEDFVRRHGGTIVRWYKEQLSVEVEPLSSFDIAEVKNDGSDGFDKRP